MTKTLGVEFSSNQLVWVLVGDEEMLSGFLRLTATREKDALLKFKSDVDGLLVKLQPDLIGIKDKPESGRMQAGSPALKMEAILLMSATAVVDFVSGARINAVKTEAEGLKEKEKVAHKAAIAALDQFKA